MAVSVVSFAPNADMFATGTPRTQSISWSADDFIVIAGGTSSNTMTLSTPTVTGLTFTLRESQTGGGAYSESSAYIWTAKAASAGSGTVSVSKSGDVYSWGYVVWRVSGADAVGVTTSNRTESTLTLNPSADSGVFYYFADWNAATTNQTIATGTGTATERADDGDGANYGFYAGDWIGVSAGSTGFGVTSYSGLQVGHVAIELTAAASGGQTLTAPTIAASSTISTPTSVTPGAVSLTAPTIAASETLFAPTVAAGSVGLTAPTIASTGAVYAPTVAAGSVGLTAPTIASAATASAPTVVVGSVGLAAPTIASTGAVYAPTVAIGATELVAPTIVSTYLTYPPVAANAPRLGAPTIASTATPYVPVVTNVAIPGAPTIESGIPGDNYLWVFASQPDDGGTPVTLYEYRLDGGTWTVNPFGDSTTIYIIGLTGEVTYSVEVRATNAVGAGPASTASNFTTGFLPDPVTDLAVAATPSGEVVLEWSAPAYEGSSPITSWRIEREASGSSSFQYIYSATPTAYIWTGLTNGVEYDFTVASDNGYGYGYGNGSNVVTAAAGTQELVPPLLSNTSTLHEPVVEAGATPIVIPTIASTVVAYPPTLIPDQRLDPPTISSTTSTYEPSVAGTGSISTPTIASTAVTVAPVVVPGPVGIEPPSIALTTLTGAPVLTPGPVSLSLPTIGSVGSTLHSPVVAPGPVSIDVPAIGPTGSTLFPPTLSPAPVSVVLPTIGSSATPHEPDSVLIGESLVMPTVASSLVAYPPSSLVPGGVTLLAPVILGTTSAFEPELFHIVELPSVSGTVAAYVPAVSLRDRLTVPTITLSSVLYTPDIVGDYIDIEIDDQDVLLIEIDDTEVALIVTQGERVYE